jgi:toxin-antitoxin system PIN domain toxin
VIAVDANILVYAHRRDMPWHDRARALVTDLASGRPAWAIPWPCAHEFLSVTTNPRLWRDPSPLAVAFDQLSAWRESGSLVFLSEADSHWDDLRAVAERGRIAGGLFHDARIAAICISHGVRELWTADRDFGRFPALSVRNPLASDD